MSPTPNTILTTTVSDAPLRGNLISDQSGAEDTPGFRALITRIWMRWFQDLVQWADLQGSTGTHPYSSGDYTHTGGGTWTVDSGDLRNFTYRLVGDTLYLNVDLQATSVAGFVGSVAVALPDIGIGSYFIAESQYFPARIIQTGTPVLDGTAQVVSTDSKVIVFDPAAAFAASTNATDISFSIAFGIKRI